MTDIVRELEAASSIGAGTPEPPRDVGAKVAENSGFLSVSAGLVGVVSYACSLLMANLLGTADYTQFAAAAMLLGVVGIVASALVPLPLSHFVAVHPAGSDGRRDGMAFSVFVSCIAGIAAAAITGGLTLAFSTPALAAAVATGALAIFVVAAPSGWLQGELRFKWYALTTIGEVLLRLGFSFLVILLAWGAVGAILGFALGALALVVVPWSFYRDLQWRPGVLRQRWRWAETSDIASVLCVVSVLVGVDVVVVAFLDEGPAAAGFQALATIAKGSVYVAAGTALVAFPLLRRPGVNVSEVLGAAFASFGQLAVVAFAIIATAPHILAGVIIPEKYHGSLELLPWLAAAGLGYAVLTVLTTILLALRAYRRCQCGLACACLLVVAGLWIGWQVNAVSGLAMGSAIGAVVAAAVLVLISWPVLAAVGPAQGAGRFIAGASVLLLLFAVASQLQPIVWLFVAAISGSAVLAHQRGLLPRTLAWGTARRRFGAPVRSAGGRSKVQGAASKRLARVLVRVVSSPAAAFAAVSAAAFGVRAFGLERGFEVWVDELLYVRLGESLTTGQVPTLPDGPFFLHPPGYFLLEAGTIRLFGISGDIVEVVLQLRWLNAVPAQQQPCIPRDVGDGLRTGRIPRLDGHPDTEPEAAGGPATRSGWTPAGLRSPVQGLLRHLHGWSYCGRRDLETDPAMAAGRRRTHRSCGAVRDVLGPGGFAGPSARLDRGEDQRIAAGVGPGEEHRVHRRRVTEHHHPVDRAERPLRHKLPAAGPVPGSRRPAVLQSPRGQAVDRACRSRFGRRRCLQCSVWHL
jgi:O-antigen/teichoic acid export membrane protein